MLAHAAVGKNATMDAWVQGLHPAIEHFRGAGNLLYFGDWNSCRRDLLRGRTGGDQLHASFMQPSGQFLQPSLVIHGNQRAANSYTVQDGLTHENALPAVR